MGVKLFRRLPRGLLLTATGETYLPSISRAFHAISEATEDAAPALKKRQLRLGLSPALSRRKLPAIERLKRHGDRLAAKLVLTDDLSELIEGKIDVLLRTSAQPPPGLHVDRIELQTIAGKPLSTTLVTLPGLAGCRAHRALVKQLVSA